MPTARTKAAFRWLMANNTYYKTYTLLQKIAIAVHRAHTDKKKNETATMSDCQQPYALRAMLQSGGLRNADPPDSPCRWVGLRSVARQTAA